MLSLRSIWRGADLRLAANVVLRAISFGTEVPQDDSIVGIYFNQAAARPLRFICGFIYTLSQ
jgi:hypothetical protein